MALLRKLFHRKPPEGLLEICERVYVFNRCFTAGALEEQDYKGYVEDIVARVRGNYPDALILAFNFREGENQSQLADVFAENDMTIVEYPRQYEGCPLLSLEVIHHFLKSCESWLTLGLQNLLLMHCERCGWPVLAFMLAALLIYRKFYSGEVKTLDMVYKHAPPDLLYLLSPLNPIPSQIRYLQYVSRRNAATEWPPQDRALTMDCVIIRTIPNFDGENGCRPIFCIYGQNPLLDSDREPKVLFSTPKNSKTLRRYKQAECELAKIVINCHIKGDIVLECTNLHEDTNREVVMFRVMFNTAFVRSNILMLNHDEIDILWDSKDLFPKDFKVEVLFSEMDATPTKTPVDSSCSSEEWDGLPVEAFNKAREIFNSIDWWDLKLDDAVEACQPLADSNAKAIGESYYNAEKANLIQSLSAEGVKSASTTDSTSTNHSNFFQKFMDGNVDLSSSSTVKMRKSSSFGSLSSLNYFSFTPNDVHDTGVDSANTYACSPPLPPSSPLNENLTSGFGPSHLPPLTSHSIENSTEKLSTCPPPIPCTAPSKENLASGDGAHNSTAVCQSPPSPPPVPSSGSSCAPVSPLKESSSSSAVPSALPSMHGGKGAPPNPPPPPLTGYNSCTHPPPSLELTNGSSGEGVPLPPPPPIPTNQSTASPSPLLPAPDANHGSTSSAYVPSAPPPPVLSTEEPRSASNSISTTGKKGSGLSVSPSPPPPFIPPPGTKGKGLLSRAITSKNTQTKKLKPLHWLKISRAVSGSLWAEGQKSGDASEAPEIDMSELETLFSAAGPDGSSSRKPSSRGSLGQKPEKVQLVIYLIDHRRAYNCEIMLSKVKIPLQDMLISVLALEDSALDIDQVENLIKFCPTTDEMEILKGYKGDTDKLGKCEQFFLELMQVPRIEYKLRVYSFKIQFHSQVSDLRKSLNVLNSAADQIKGSSKLKRIMKTILSLGNALNHGTARGSAVGFRLDSLLKLTETRARNSKTTLMHYLCKVLFDKLPELLDFWQDLSSIEPASKIQLKFLADEMQAINKGLEKVFQELTMSESDGPVSDQFQKSLTEFLSFAEDEVKSLSSLYGRVGRNLDSLINYFGEDPARCPLEQVMSILLNFVRMFKKAHEENLLQLEFDKKQDR
ncbi:formin-like protein 18 [Andrographis paniculata]|uniref:formin-like protein 18 n=1 Tax=Andrographis paniculata TaxID=175694 RepID=UPI0021E893DD|nr:formin-like protein 18 [Andrographis paniculata]